MHEQVFHKGYLELRNHIRILEKAPDIDDRLAGEIELAIGRMRRAEDEQIAAADDVVEREQFRIGGERIGGDERVGGHHRLGEARERLLELVAQRRRVSSMSALNAMPSRPTVMRERS